MAVKLAMVMNLAVLALLLAAVSASARSVDLFHLLASNNPEALQLVKHKKSNVEACCDMCVCTKSIPPLCTCWDTFIGNERCKGCDTCVCTFGIPPQCSCLDVNNYCLPECKTTGSAKAAVAAAIASSK